jgi:hypothetical protein
MGKNARAGFLVLYFHHSQLATFVENFSTKKPPIDWGLHFRRYGLKMTPKRPPGAGLMKAKGVDIALTA